jgi:hypothetical protein
MLWQSAKVPKTSNLKSRTATLGAEKNTPGEKRKLNNYFLERTVYGCA